MYLDYAGFAVDVARGRDLDDSALVLAAEWPTVSQLRQLHLHEHLIAARGTVTPAEADSAYRAGARRVFQHILVRVPANAPPAVERDKKRQAEDLRRQAGAAAGAPFARPPHPLSAPPGAQP